MVGREETVKLLSTFSDDELKEFLYSCMDELCGRKGPDLLQLRSNSRFIADEFKGIVENVKTLCCECIAMDLDFDKLKEKLTALNHNQCNIVHSCVATRKNEINSFVNVEQLEKNDQILSDYDWKLKWVVGSSAFSAMNEPLLALDFHLKSWNGSRTMNMELDKAELKILIEALDKAQQSMVSRLSNNI